MPSISRILLAIPLLSSVLLPGSARAQGRQNPPGPVAYRFGARGLTSLWYLEREYLKDGTFRVVKAEMETPEGKPVPDPLKSGRWSFNLAAHKASWRYDWGSVSCFYKISRNRLVMTVRVENDGPNTLRGLAVQPLEFRFPARPKDWPEGWPLLGHNLGTPTVLGVSTVWSTLAVVNEDVSRPLLVGFPARSSMTERPLWVASYNADRWLSPYLDPYLSRPVYPGGRDTYHISVRFGWREATATMLAEDVYRKFRAAYPMRLHWPDRRPIGALFLSSTVPHHPNNPRGWFNNDAATDVTTEAGRAKFREDLRKYAEGSIKVLKGMGAQGMIAWDVEGQENPHAISYLGDPRSLPPEIEPAIDAFFKAFRDAGLRVGVTLRPQLPLRPAYGEAVNQYEVPDPAANLMEKVAYAKKRWGCTLFYVDSNGDPNVPIPAEIFQNVAAANPDALLLPEHENARYYAYTAPFNSFLHQGVTGTPDAVRAIYPDAFSVIYAPDGPIEAHRKELVESVRRGDILMFHGWWDNPNNALIREIVREGMGGNPSK